MLDDQVATRAACMSKVSVVAAGRRRTVLAAIEAIKRALECCLQLRIARAARRVHNLLTSVGDRQGCKVCIEVLPACMWLQSSKKRAYHLC